MTKTSKFCFTSCKSRILELQIVHEDASKQLLGFFISLDEKWKNGHFESLCYGFVESQDILMQKC